MNDTDNSSSTTSKSPTHVAYHVREGKSNDKGFWTRIGAAWAHKDGKGFNIQLEVAPLDGRVNLPRRNRQQVITSTGRAACPPTTRKGISHD